MVMPMRWIMQCIFYAQHRIWDFSFVTHKLFSVPTFLCINEPLAPSHDKPSSGPMMPNRTSLVTCSAMISGSCGVPRCFLLPAAGLGPGPLSPYLILNSIFHHCSPIGNPNVPTHLRHLRELQLNHVIAIIQLSMSNEEPDI